MKQRLIYQQNKLWSHPFGRFTSDYNGCGWIAAYNALTLLGFQVEDKTVREQLSKHLRLGGRFGLMPAALAKYLKQQGAAVKWCFGVNPCVKAWQSGAVCICFFWRSNLSAHYVAFEQTDKCGIANMYNCSWAQSEGEPVEQDIAEYLRGERSFLNLFFILRRKS